MQDPIRLHGNHSSAFSDHDAAAMVSASTKSRQPTMNPYQQQQKQEQQSHLVVLKVRLGGNSIHPSNNSSYNTGAKSSPPLVATREGIAIGTLSSAAFHCNNDPMVSPEHGTLECTAKHGIWVYVDHSLHGTKLNNSRRVHQDAAVVRSGDRLLVGNTEIELQFEAPTARDRRDGPPLRQPGNRHHQSNTADSDSNKSSNQAVIAPSPITWPATAGKTNHLRLGIPKIETSGDSFSTATPPEYIASPVPGVNWRRKRHSMTAFTPTPSPPPPGSAAGSANQHSSNSPSMYHRARPLVPSVPSTPPRQVATRPCTAVNVSPHQPYGHVKWKGRPEDDDDDDDDDGDDDNEDQEKESRTKAAPPPPLDYSSSPVLTPSFLQRGQPHFPPNPSPPSQQRQQQHAHHAADPPKSRRDDLRIQVSKKMAGVVNSKRAGGNAEGGRPAPVGIKIPLPTTPSSSRPVSKKPTTTNNQLDFTPPSSPVAHKDILRQNESLLNILKHKYKEEQLLKQQQEEWMRHNFNLGSATPPMSPIKNGKSASANNSDDGERDDAADDDADTDMCDLQIPPHAPALLRTISLGLHQASPRLTAAVLASRARVGSFDNDKRSNQRFSPRSATNVSQDSDAGFSSVGSSVSTQPACHRRVTRSLSFSSDEEDVGSSAELDDFIGYDDEVDGLTSFTTHDLYASSDEYASTSRDDESMRQFPSYSPSNASPSRTVSTTSDRFAIDIVPSSREPEDDDVLKSPPRWSAASAHSMRKAGSTPNLFDVRAPLSNNAGDPTATTTRAHRHRNDPSPIETPSSSQRTARRFRRIPSPV